MNADQMTIGIDVGGSAVKVAARAPDGTARLAISPAYARPNREALRDAARHAVQQVLPSGSRTSAVGLCVPGRRAAAGDRVELAVNVPGLEDYCFADLVRDAVGHDCPVTVVADAEAATVDASASHPGARRVLGIAMGTGVGAALIEDGVPLRIGRGSIGHFGQIDIGPVGDAKDAPVGPDGGRNGLEAFLGVAALRARLGEPLPEHLATLPDSDPAFVALVRAVRIGLAIYAPDLVLILGGVGLGLAGRAEAIDRAVRTDLTRVAPVGWRLGFATSRHHAALGAASMAAAASATRDLP